MIYCNIFFFVCVGISHGECRGMGVLAIEGCQAVQFVTQSQIGDVLPSINLKAGNGTSVNVPIYIYGSMPRNYHIPGEWTFIYPLVN